MKIAYLESGYKANAADRRRLWPLIAQAPAFDIEMVPYTPDVLADVLLVRGREHSAALYSQLMRLRNAVVLVFDDPNDLTSILRVSLVRRSARGIRYWVRLRRHPADVLRSFVKGCDLIIQGSTAQNAAIAGEVRGAWAVVDTLPAAEFDGTCKMHRDTARPVLLWDGAGASFPQLEAIEPALAEAARRVDFKLIVFTDRELRLPRRRVVNIPERIAGFRCNAEYMEWRKDRLRSTLLEADVALAPVDCGQNFNRVKPANKMISYWAYGLPPIVSLTPAYQEVAEDGADALLAPDLASWTDSIVRLVRSVELRRTMGRAGYVKAWSRYGERQFADRYFAFLRERVKARGLPQ